MNFLEKDLEQIIWESDNKKLNERGLFIYGKKYRQLKIGNYGVADLVTYSKGPFNKSIDITIFELKKEKAGISAFLQAVRYMKGIDRYLKTRNVSFDYDFHIVLCAKEIEHNDYIYLADYISSQVCFTGSISSLKNYSFEYGLDGINFIEEIDYRLTNEGFDVKA